MNEQTKPIPDGYLEDSERRLVPIDTIKPERLLENEVVTDLCIQMEALAEFVAQVKAQVSNQIAGYVSLLAENYGVHTDGAAGGVTLVSFDGRLKVERVLADSVSIGPEIAAAEALVRQIVDEIQEPTAKAIANRAFRRNRNTGELSVSRLVDLANAPVDDARWERAAQAIKDALRTVGKTVYYRAYRRAQADQPWQQIVPDFSRVAPAEQPDGAFAERVQAALAKGEVQ
jgi:hypothetical protein